jgi:hypothetical protein
MCLFALSGVYHILCCVFVLFVCILYCQFLWIIHFPLSLRYSLTFISNMLTSCLFVLQVRLTIYINGSEVAFFLFDGHDSNEMDWMNQTRLLNSSYSDMSNSKSTTLRYSLTFISNMFL